MKSLSPGDLTVGGVVWELPSQLHEVQAEAVQKLGYAHRYVFVQEPLPRDLDILLIQGPYGSMLPLFRQVAARKAAGRPAVAYWFQQSLSLIRPEWLCELAAGAFSDLRSGLGDGVGYRALDRIAGPLLNKGSRLRFLGDILWLSRHGLVEVLALSSTVYAGWLERRGIPSVVVPRGHHPSYGRVMDLERPIAAVWMGKIRTKRRRERLYWLRDQLTKRGLEMRIHDGVEKPFIFDDERTEILNRARFVLNIYFAGPDDELSIRFFVAAANGAVVLTEPGRNRYPFVPGKHLVESAFERMPDVIEYYVQHEDERRAIADRMHKLVTEDLTLERSAKTILDLATTALVRRQHPIWLTIGQHP